MTKRVGRPRKTDIEKNTKGNRGKVGRPAGDAKILNEYKAMMITSPKSKKVINKIFDAALDDDHKHQSAAWKIVADRILPLGLFDSKEASRPGAIQININTVSEPEIVGGEVIDSSDE